MKNNPKRPPARWWSMMWSKTASGYRRKKNESLEHWRMDISRITGGIWTKYSPLIKEQLVRRYAHESRALANPVMLPCPACGILNPVAKSGVYMKCQKCSKNLVSVKVRKKY